MSIQLNAITGLSARDMKFPGGLYTLVWDQGVLSIGGVDTWEQFAKLVAALTGGTPPAGFMAHNGNGGIAAGSQEAPPAGVEPPAPGPRQAAPAEPGQRAAPPGGPPPAPRRPPAPPRADMPEGADLSVYGRLTKFEDIFDEVLRRNEGADFTLVQMKFQELLDTEMCPALDRLNKDGKLADRIKRRCAAKGIEGALDA